MHNICSISGKPFQVSAHEKQLRDRFGFGNIPPKISPKYRLQYVGAFWHHWNLHKRKCDRTGKPIISVFRPDCAYPVWHRDEWIAHANPPSADFDFSRPFFEQAWDLFRKCPIPHTFQSHNQNCEYTDDWYYSKNCYLCHSGENCEDCRYCYGCGFSKNIHYGVISFYSEFCMDIINSVNCFNSLFLLNCKHISDSAFLYDCRNCDNCLFCSNLRNKKYCFGNQQLTKEEFEEKKKEWDFSRLKDYEKAKKFFSEMMMDIAWHRALQIDLCDNSTGNFIRNCKDCENCYMLTYHENCANVSFSGPHAKTILDSVGTVGGEVTFMCSLPVYCYDARFCFSTSHCRFTEYCANLQNCQYCFGCCGLVNEKYCILNKKYQKKEYEKLVPEIIDHMKEYREYGEFFPKHFAPNPYNESYAGFYFPILKENPFDFKETEPVEKVSVKTAETSDIPNSVDSLDPEKEKWLLNQVFWDEKYKHPFQIQQADIDFARKMKTPLPHNYYINHMQSNLSWMPFNGELRNTTCAKSGKTIKTNWPAAYNERILSEEEYLKFVK